jgi:hypothetical protein
MEDFFRRLFFVRNFAIVIRPMTDNVNDTLTKKRTITTTIKKQKQKDYGNYSKDYEDRRDE